MLEFISASNSASYIYIYIYRASLTFLFLLLLPVILSSNSAFAESVNYSVTIDPSINVALSASTLTLGLNPVSKAFATGDLDVTVSSNSGNGYKLTVTSAGNNTSLVNADDNTKTIPTLPIVIGTTSGSSITSYTEDNFPVNTWGYKIGTSTASKYLPFISGTTIAMNNAPTAEDTTRLTFASKIDYNQPSGLYTINLTFNGTANPTSPAYMQNLDPTLCVSDHPTLVVDSRDNRSYYIQRLADDKCWMIQNLRLGQDLATTAGALILTDQDTNISANDTYNPRTEFVLTNKIPEPGEMPKKVVDGNNVWDDTAFYCTSDYGCYYNFYTATAGIKSEGEGAVTTSNTDTTTTICPRGWTMPTGGNHNPPTHNSEFRALVDAYGYNVDLVATVTSRLLVNPTSSTENINGENAPGFLLGGHYISYGAQNIGTNSMYWSRTVFSAAAGNGLNMSTGSVNPGSTGNRANARAIRCLLQE